MKRADTSQNCWTIVSWRFHLHWHALINSLDLKFEVLYWQNRKINFRRLLVTDSCRPLIFFLAIDLLYNARMWSYHAPSGALIISDINWMQVRRMEICCFLFLQGIDMANHSIDLCVSTNIECDELSEDMEVVLPYSDHVCTAVNRISASGLLLVLTHLYKYADCSLLFMRKRCHASDCRHTNAIMNIAHRKDYKLFLLLLELDIASHWLRVYRCVFLPAPFGFEILYLNCQPIWGAN